MRLQFCQILAPKINRYQFRTRYGRSYKGDMPDSYIKGKGIIFERIAEKGATDHVELRTSNKFINFRFSLRNPPPPQRKRGKRVQRKWDVGKVGCQSGVTWADSILVNNGYRPNPTGARPFDLNREATDGEPIRSSDG